MSGPDDVPAARWTGTATAVPPDPAHDDTTPDDATTDDATRPVPEIVTLDHVDDDVVEAIGLASEALEYIERARGALYEFHQLTGHADFGFEEAADRLEEAGLDADAEVLRRDVIGRNVLDGRWTFQIIEEFEASYYRPVRDAVQALADAYLEGHRHVYEARLKQARRTHGRRMHEEAPTVATDSFTDR